MSGVLRSRPTKLINKKIITMKNKNKKILISSLVFIVAAAAVMTIAQNSYAADAATGATNASNTSTQLNRHGKFGKMGNWLNKNTDQATKDALQAERIKRQEAVQAALKAGDYNAWVQAVGTSSPMLTKINKDNFAKFVQAHELRLQADAIMTELGINPGEGRGQGGMMNGEGRGMMGGYRLNDSVTK